MDSLRQIGTGILLSILSIAIIVGAFSLAMAEGGLVAAVPPTSTPAPIVLTIFPTLPSLATNTPVGTIAASPTSTASFTPTPPPPPTSCPPPIGWLPIVIRSGDTLASIARAYRSSEDALRNANCLFSNELVAGSFLYVPPQPTATSSPCGAPPGWVDYTILPNDTLYRLSLLYHVSIQQLQQANCLPTSNIKTGQKIKVPYVIPSTPIATSTPIPTLTEAPTSIPTDTISPTPDLPPATNTPSPTTIPDTETPTPTELPPPSNTPEPTIPPTVAPEATATP